MGGVISDKDKYSELFLRITRVATIMVSLVAIIYGVAVMFGAATPSPAYNRSLSIIIFCGLILLSIVQYIYRPSTSTSLGIFVGTFHVLFILYLIFGPGVTNPVAYCWIVLALITEIFYGKFAAMFSLLLIASSFAFLYLIEPVMTANMSLEYTIYLIVIVLSSSLVIRLRSVQTVEHQDLKRARGQGLFERDQLTALINSLNAAILSVSSNGKVRVYNAALLSLMDTNQSLGGMKADDVLNLYDAHGEPVSIVSLTRKANKNINFDNLSHRFSDGEVIRLNISCAPIRGRFSNKGGVHKGYIFIMRDITQEKSLEEERDEFISVVSHELRTPITIVEGSLSNLQLLLERNHDPASLINTVEEAHGQILYLANMVNDLSTLSRAERGVANAPEQVDVRALLEEIYHRYHGEASEKHLELNIDAGHKLGSVLISRLYLEEILQNFVTNALKYTQKGSVSIAAHRRRHNIEFVVSDTGIGISKSEQRHIFEKFYRSEDFRTRETSGTGLGLYVVQKLADKLNTTIKIESRLNHGSKFSFVITDDPLVNKSHNKLDESGDDSVHLT